MEKLMNNIIKILGAVMIAFILSIPVAAQRDKGVPAVNLSVTIDDSVSATAGIRSDDAGAYTHGVSGVQATFLSTGVLSFKTGTRQLTALYSTPIEPLAALPASDTQSNSTMLTFVKSGFYLQTMAVKETRCEGLVVGIPISTDYTRYIGYRAGRGDLRELAYVLVSHPDENTWIMDSQDSGCSEYGNIARINDAKNKGKANDIFHGRYFMPLRMTLTRQ
jgi:hypothetical protein